MSENGINRDEDVMNRSKWELTKRLLSYLKPYFWKTIGVIGLMLFVMGCTIATPYLLKIAIDTYVAQKDTMGLIEIGIFLLVINVLAMFASQIRWSMISSITNHILVNIRHQLYTHIQKLSFSFFDNRPVGKILARVMGDVNALQNLFNQSIQSLVPELLSLVVVSIVMLMMNVKLALACILLLPFLGISMFIIEVQSRKRWNIYRKKRSNINAFTHEDFSGIKIVQAFTREKEKEKTFKQMVSELMNSFMRAVRLNDLFWPFVELSWGVGTVIVFYVGYNLIRSGEIQLGTLVAFSMYVGMFWRPIMNLANFYNTFITNLSAADRIFDILEIEPDIVSSENGTKMKRIEGNVEFQSVSFAYGNGKKVLNNVDLVIPSGSKVALVGPTGAGKTTIVSLLSRFYDPTSGQILVDNQNIKDVDLESYRQQMGIMLQDTFLFSTTIMENIRYGRLDATDEEVVAAAKAVHAHEFIEKLDKGYRTEVNERGSRLSLGQRQLISFARALLADPRILILDEATSNIDTHTEKLVQNGIERLLECRTSFVIAHRLSTIRDCDIILVIDEGEVKEKGTHDELLSQKGLYHQLYTSQYRFVHEGA